MQQQRSVLGVACVNLAAQLTRLRQEKLRTIIIPRPEVKLLDFKSGQAAIVNCYFVNVAVE